MGGGRKRGKFSQTTLTLSCFIGGNLGDKWEWRNNEINVMVV